MRYSNFVGLMKVLLPTGAAALTALVVAWPLLTGRDEGVPISFANVEFSGPETPLMSNALSWPNWAAANSWLPRGILTTSPHRS